MLHHGQCWDMSAIGASCLELWPLVLAPSVLSQTMPLVLQTSIHWLSSAAATQAWASVGASALNTMANMASHAAIRR